MNVHTRTTASIVIVDVEGAVEGETAGPSPLLERVRALLDEGASCLLLNVDHLASANSLTLGLLVQAYVTATRRGRTLKLVGVAPPLRHLLQVTKLDKVVETFDSEEAALASFVLRT
jgi:anti-anti-sigma factor